MAEISTDTRITFRLSPEARREVEEIKAIGKFDTIQEAIGCAISDELYFIKLRKAGWTVLLSNGNEYCEVVWPKH